MTRETYVPRDMAEYTLLIQSVGIPVIGTLFWNKNPHDRIGEFFHVDVRDPETRETRSASGKLIAVLKEQRYANYQRVIHDVSINSTTYVQVYGDERVGTFSYRVVQNDHIVHEEAAGNGDPARALQEALAYIYGWIPPWALRNPGFRDHRDTRDAS